MDTSSRMNFANLAFRDLNRTNPCIKYVDSDVVLYVGSLNADIDVNEQEVVVERLMDDFNCVHTFLANELFSKLYHGFCKYHLRPIFHYMLPMCEKHGDQFDQGMWQAYISANKILADKVLEVANPETNYILIHDYHLMAILVFLRNKRYRAKLGFFLQSPFLASAEIYRTLPVSADILKILLNCDLIGFHTFDFARHLLSCCSRMLGLDYESKRGQIGLDYSVKVKEFEGKFKGKHVIVGVDDMNLFKAISLKLLAFEQLLRKYENLRAIVVLVQIINPERSSGEDIEEVRREKYGTANRINQIYGSCGHQLVSLIDRPVDQCEKNACYAASECCIVNAVRDGMTLVPHMYIICGQGSSTVDEASGIMSYFPRTSVLIIYKYVGCSPSLSGAIRINSWDISSLAEAMHSAVTMDNSLRQLRHEQNYNYVQSHDVAYMARSFLHSMERACLDHYNYQCWGLGFSFTFKVAALSLGFQKLFFESIVPAYKKTNRRAIFLDFDGTLVPHSSTKNTAKLR
ncbi:probable alpha,alpha-trehalose-phosphate synthase [UDP-forming] 9 [Daucus carota subsp. sativus]|uniref:probable alpha,alpha-trehalose-phosphate synthase [UDP-forming] 9 n=1 Tax=Daucus carota subsp. sativus TaxID=79200 RepID=UPI0030827D6D